MRTIKLNYFVAIIAGLIVILFLSFLFGVLFGIKDARADEILNILPYLIQAESGGNPNAIGKNGEIGILQISPIVLKEYNQINGGMHKRYACKEPKPMYKDNKFLFFKWKTVWGYDESDNWILEPLVKNDLYDTYVNSQVATWYLRRIRDVYLKDYIMQIPTTGFQGKVYITKSWRENGKLKYPLEGTFTVELDNFKCIRSFDDYKLALILCAYNFGIGNLKKVNYDLTKCPESTQDYVRKILSAYQKAKNE